MSSPRAHLREVPSSAVAFIAFPVPTGIGACAFTGSSARSSQGRTCGRRGRGQRFKGESEKRERIATSFSMCNKESSVDGNEPQFGDIFDDLESDDEYVIVDSSDVSALIEEMQKRGEDSLIGVEEEDELFMKLAEQRSDARRDRAKEGSDKASNSGVHRPAPMEYFTDANLAHMPKWAREAYLDGKHEELEKGSQVFSQDASRRRLHSILAAEQVAREKESDQSVRGAGILDCTVQDVATDYNLPVEFVVDVLIEYGVKTPVTVDDRIKRRLSREEIEKLLFLITSFDAKDLSDRYSDRTLFELADDYDLDLAEVLQVCEEEGIFLPLEHDTRLQLTREDRILDILIKDAPRRQHYPSLLEGLQSMY